jgi:hypothetical protein
MHSPFVIITPSGHGASLTTGSSERMVTVGKSNGKIRDVNVVLQRIRCHQRAQPGWARAWSPARTDTEMRPQPHSHVPSQPRHGPPSV